jgi:hypothetical protein
MIEIIPLGGISEILPGDDLPALLARALASLYLKDRGRQCGIPVARALQICNVPGQPGMKGRVVQMMVQPAQDRMEPAA